jgi:hypothetical protein
MDGQVNRNAIALFVLFIVLFIGRADACLEHHEMSGRY